jgi:putative thioredoxin
MSQPQGTDRFANSSMPDLGTAPAGGGAPRAAVIVEVDEASFPALVERSSQVPIVVDLWATWCEPCKQLSPALERAVAGYGGRLILAKVDVDKNPNVAAAFQVKSVPSVVALIKGQPVPLFQGAQPEAQIKAVLDEVLKVASQNGVTGVVAPATEGDAESESEVVTPIPPLHQEGYDALERGDLAAAKAAFAKALAESPADAAAKAALSQVGLLERLDQADPKAVARGQVPGAAIEDTLAAADSEVGSGNAEAGLTLLLAALRGANPDNKEAIRLRLIDLFEVVGADDPAVVKARRNLAAALF